jgi:hypothetical protein
MMQFLKMVRDLAKLQNELKDFVLNFGRDTLTISRMANGIGQF